MRKQIVHRSRKVWLVFGLTFGIWLVLGAAYGSAIPAAAAPAAEPSAQEGVGYAGPEVCAACHTDIHEEWEVSRHAQAFSSPIFQQNWEELGSAFSCLKCHTTGYNATIGVYAFEGVTCESCHGPLQSGHPVEPMPVTPNAELCSACHETTKNEWEASQHGQMGLQCQACHDPHGQFPKAESVTALCVNCHKDTGSSFTHGTHSEADLECSSCHMYTSPRTEAPIQGLVPTGHTFSVGSEACIGCHQDTVHTRNTIVELTGEVEELSKLDIEDLRIQVQEQEETISDLESRNSVRLYTGLAQGAIIGLATGAVAAWVVSKRIEVVELEGDEDE
jgi:predicted CXXCH cytochrome family protein